MSEIRNFGTMDLVLARKTIDIRTGTADPPPFDNNRSLAGFPQMPSKIFPAFTASDNYVLVPLGAHFASLLQADVFGALSSNA
jgi:hypothetical protein